MRSFLLATLATLAFLPRASALTEPNYNFDPQKLAAATNAFHFLRTYVDYYYLLAHTNAPLLPTLTDLEDVGGWCVGDAHPENFGAMILSNGSSLFTVNDIDDAGPCPVVLDFARLLVSSRLAISSTPIADLQKSYVAGLRGAAMTAPDSVTALLAKSAERGAVVETESVSLHKILRDPNMEQVTPQEASAIAAALTPVLPKGFGVLDEVSTRKVGGGSGGLLRYEVLVSLPTAPFELHLELKQEVQPGIAVVATAPIPNEHDRLLTTLALEQNSLVSNFYNVVSINGLDFLLRPRFAGNVGVKLDDLDQSSQLQLFSYEAYILGRLHAASVADAASWASRIEAASLENDVSALSTQFDIEFALLKARAL